MRCSVHHPLHLFLQWSTSALVLLVGCVLCMGGGIGCSEDPISSPEDFRVDIRISVDGQSRTAESLKDMSPLVRDALDELQKIGSFSLDSPSLSGSAQLELSLDSSLNIADTPNAYQLHTQGATFQIKASNQIGLSYGLYHLLQDWGVRYIHPEQSHYPSQAPTSFPQYDNQQEIPLFEDRGFHEHTQHPIVMSDFLLRPGRDDFRVFVSNYLFWLARNRQNMVSFHLLNTVDLESWVPYLTDIVEEAHTLGIQMGMITGFVDQQQNAFRLYKPNEEGSAELQITTKLDRLLSTGLDYIGFQIGTSEFTKPDDQQVIDWLNLAVAHIRIQFPQTTPYAWIHITCGLEQENGLPFYHLPLQADTDLGAFVHTTMFYTLDHPAPVYECEDFTHQKDFFEQANEQRRLVFFPETAWWLGFDNNIPLVNPITGKSREYDIHRVLPEWTVQGHATFTTGREWTYWQYDHYLTQTTWSLLTWEEYLQWIAPLYGEFGQQIADLLNQWTERQWQDLYEDYPEIYFYIAGELPQDELGQQAGILARRPKRAYQEIVDLDDSAFRAWQDRDLSLLRNMRDTYQGLFSSLLTYEPQEDPSFLFLELKNAYQLFVLRIEHSLALYEGVSAVRSGEEEDAQMHLEVAKMIGDEALTLIRQIEPHYRYPAEILINPKPESLTAYPFGYLHETSTGYFWDRREDQLEQFIHTSFTDLQEEWTEEVILLLKAQGEDLDLAQPNNPVLKNALSGFIPQILVATPNEAPLDQNQDTMRFAFAQDANLNHRPDEDTQIWFEGQRQINEEEGIEWTASFDQYALIVRDGVGSQVGQLQLQQGTSQLKVDEENYIVSLSARVSVAEIIQLVTSVAGIEPDALGQLIKTIWGLPLNEDLPDTLPMTVRFNLSTHDE